MAQTARRGETVFIRLSANDAPPELRGRLVADAVARRSSLTRVICDILAGRYEVTIEQGEQRKTSPQSDPDYLNPFLPGELLTAVEVAAALHGRRRQREILHTLCGHYDLEFPARSAAAA